MSKVFCIVGLLISSFVVSSAAQLEVPLKGTAFTEAGKSSGQTRMNLTPEDMVSILTLQRDVQDSELQSYELQRQTLALNAVILQKTQALQDAISTLQHKYKADDLVFEPKSLTFITPAK